MTPRPSFGEFMRGVALGGCAGIIAASGGPAVLGAQPVHVATRARPSGAHPGVPPAVLALAGCYRLSVRPVGAGWVARMTAAFRGERTSVPLPDVIRLDTASGPMVRGAVSFRLGPDITDSHVFPFVPGWRLLDGNTLVLNWHDGLAGSTAHLERTTAGWRGLATYSEDVVPSPTPRAAVTMRRVPCAG